MTEPRVPGADDSSDALSLPCGNRVDPREIDLGMRAYDCACGDRHAVVTDVHPPSRFFPESFVSLLSETIEPAEDDAFDEFGTPHLMGIVLEEFPERVVAHDAAGDGAVGYAACWMTDFDARRLHEIVVELVLELMEHAISHAEDDAAAAAFESQLFEFDVAEFVEEYRSVRDFETAGDRPA